jgi:hypothetical protein
LKNPGTDTVAFAICERICQIQFYERYLIDFIAMLNYVRAVGGYTLAASADTAFDTDVFRECDYVAHVNASTGNIDIAMNWYDLISSSFYGNEIIILP